VPQKRPNNSCSEKLIRQKKRHAQDAGTSNLQAWEKQKNNKKLYLKKHNKKTTKKLAWHGSPKA